MITNEETVWGDKTRDTFVDKYEKLSLISKDVQTGMGGDMVSQIPLLNQGVTKTSLIVLKKKGRMITQNSLFGK